MVRVYDDRADVTYFLRRVGDPLVFAVVVFDSFQGRQMADETQFLLWLGSLIVHGFDIILNSGSPLTLCNLYFILHSVRR